MVCAPLMTDKPVTLNFLSARVPFFGATCSQSAVTPLLTQTSGSHSDSGIVSGQTISPVTYPPNSPGRHRTLFRRKALQESQKFFDVFVGMAHAAMR